MLILYSEFIKGPVLGKNLLKESLYIYDILKMKTLKIS